MKKTFTLICIITSITSEAQNLVANGDFESFTTCPSSAGQINLATNWTNPLIASSPDYLNQCAPPGGVNVPDCTYGFQQAHGGGGMAGISLWSDVSPNFRENIETPLTAPLVAGACYHFEMYVNRGNNGIDSTSDIGVYFSDILISGVNNLFSFIPQITNPSGNAFDTLSWTLVSGNFTAAGGESYMIIGNLKDDASTVAGIAYPNASYHIAYAYIDDVSLTVCTGINNPGIQNSEFQIYQNPSGELIIGALPFVNNEKIKITINDVQGKKIFETQSEIQNPKSEIKINISNFRNGIYFVELNNGKEKAVKKFIKI